MISIRRKMVVKVEFKKTGLKYISVKLGEVENKIIGKEQTIFNAALQRKEMKV